MTLDAWESVPPGNETALMQAVSQHPVAVGMCCGDYLDVRSIARHPWWLPPVSPGTVQMLMIDPL